jgi:hypothetical protein
VIVPPSHELDGASGEAHLPSLADWNADGGNPDAKAEVDQWAEERPHERDYWHGAIQGRLTSAGLTTAQYKSVPTGKWQWRNVTNQVFAAGEKCFNCIGTWTMQHWREPGDDLNSRPHMLGAFVENTVPVPYDQNTDQYVLGHQQA